jgi:tetratricopeptide (TPR) repeat protein
LNEIFLSKGCFNITNTIFQMLSKRLFIIFGFFLLVSCSTQKNTWWSRNYNSLTARYNTLYNGEQSFKRGEQQLMKSGRENYNSILPIFPYSGHNKAGAVKGDMDRAIEKAHKVIRKKSITARPRKRSGRNEDFYNRREFNRWVDDAYILTGKAHLYNHEFNDALTVLEFAIREFPSQPVRFEALIWMAKTRIEMGDYENALLLLNRYDALGQPPNRLYSEYMATYADYLIRSGQYQTAIPFMITAANEATGKWNRGRRYYILAQLYQQSGQYQNAQESYRKVLRTNPDYEMNLNARLNYAITGGMATGNYAETRRELYKQVRQVKNQEFRDRIYFALGESYLSEKDTLMAITNFRLASGYNMDNAALKTETYLKLAELYFDVPAYITSYAYYDSTLIQLPDYDRRKKDVREKHRGLKNLSENLITINREDSLQRLAKLTETELDEFIVAIIETERQAQLNQSVGGTARHRNEMDSDPLFFRNLTSQINRQAEQQGQWYFYNPTTVSLGKMEFERRWGRRASEDNWRRSDKSTQETPSSVVQPSAIPGDPNGNGMQLPENGMPVRTGQRPTTSLPSKEDLMADIPLTPEQKKLSEDRLVNAIFQAGMVFIDHFENPTSAIEMFKKLVTEHPNHELAEQAWFWAFIAYRNLENSRGMNEMKAGLLSNFPDGRYSDFVKDPDFAEKQREREKKLNTDYNNAFEAYSQNRFVETLAITAEIKSHANNEELIRKSMLLSAVAYGKTGNPGAFRSELISLQTLYPVSREGNLAGRWLAMLDEGRQPIPGVSTLTGVQDGISGIDIKADTASEKSIFIFNPEEQHFVFLIVNSDANVNRLLFNLADFNFSRFLIANYDLETLALPNGQRVITIGAFPNGREARDYYYGLRSNTHLLRVENNFNPMLMAGAKSNLDALISSGNLTGYRTFFSDNYLSGGGGITINLAFVQEEAPSVEQTTFTTRDGAHWAMVVVPPRTDVNRVSGFLSSHALNNFQMRILTRRVNLKGGETVILVESFNSREEANTFVTSLKDVAFWNNQLRATNWIQTIISPENFAVVEQQGKTLDYNNFISDQEL